MEFSRYAAVFHAGEEGPDKAQTYGQLARHILDSNGDPSQLLDLEAEQIYDLACLGYISDAEAERLNQLMGQISQEQS